VWPGLLKEGVTWPPYSTYASSINSHRCNLDIPSSQDNLPRPLVGRFPVFDLPGCEFSELAQNPRCRRPACRPRVVNKPRSYGLARYGKGKLRFDPSRCRVGPMRCLGLEGDAKRAGAKVPPKRGAGPRNKKK
jgi:hypothetical protein